MLAEELTIEGAFQVFSLDPGCTLAELTEAFHNLSRKHHPDSTGDDGTVQARINIAYETAAASLKNRQLVLVEVNQLVRKMDVDIAVRGAAARSQEYRAVATRKRVRPLQTWKYLALIFAAAAAVLGWFGGELLGSRADVFGSGPTINPSGSNLFKRVAVVLGAIGGAFQFLVNHQTYLIESLNEKLRTKSGASFAW